MSGPDQSPSQREIAAGATLAAKYPQVRTAIARSGQPMDVDDRALAEQVHKEYVALVEADDSAQDHPVFKLLQARGFEAKISHILPSIETVVPKQTVQELAKRDDVFKIYLAR